MVYADISNELIGFIRYSLNEFAISFFSSRDKVGVHDSSVSFDMKRIFCGFSDFMVVFCVDCLKLLNELWRSLSKSTKLEICKQIQEEGTHNSKP
ncbi:hypothetical protein Sjap_007405 [Stephania japonica]|uniref:Uncharacterized protein n=1 Tax=Stephania japonica TaxID=461633 RepID=A0AAP0PDI5_9MAGN